jgi:predicted amidohydrolase
MRTVRVALAQIAPELGNVDRNLARHRDAVAQAGKERADVVVFPELSLTGYLLRDQVPEVAIGPGDPVFTELERLSRAIDLVVGFVEEAAGHRFHNAAAYFSRGRLLHLHRKLYLPDYGMFQEGRDFARGERLRRFDAPHGPSGLLVCEDLWHQTCSWLLAQEGAEVLFTISNGPTRGAKPGREITSLTVWADLLRVSAQFLTSFLVYVNRVGCEDGLIFGGGSMVVDPFGRAVATLPALEESIVTVELEAELLRRARTAYPLLRDEDLELVRRELERIRRARFDLPADPDSAGRAEP